ncbi:hypothetical protein AKJ56_01365 [candidate division MSBL1 archaeon SCGC-AAA382N08]|uniref:Uncharacterized protein n=1 Tax=candidate division MSBL1 archaeon SCGC-AAA382N08 TaxID=1698285 RepID=A0A133VPQ9_9EURY|nr:hypothetical protein AKJ56_01365 [candidate division MSBL1 archaeon SCGC-AAA382N08]
MKPGKNGFRWGTDFRETLITFYKLNEWKGGYVTADDILNELWSPSEKAPKNLRMVILHQLQKFREKGWAELPEDASKCPKENCITEHGESAARYYMKNWEGE